MRKLGLVTIGQSPRVDITPDLRPLLSGIDLIEAGALDGLTEDELRTLQAARSGNTLASRLRDGREILVGETDILPRVERAATGLASEGVEAVLLLCTGHFPTIEPGVPVLYPEIKIQAIVGALFSNGRLGILTPSEEQLAFQEERWSSFGSNELRVVAATPYLQAWHGDMRKAAEEFERAGVTLVVMDCLGYSNEMRSLVREVVGVPVILARTLLGRIAAELATN